MAIAAVDLALWDLKAKVLHLPLHRLLGACRDDVPGLRQRRLRVDDRRPARRAAAHWTERPRRHDGQDQGRRAVGHQATPRPGATSLVRDTVGPDVEVFVDANGGYTPARQGVWVGVRRARRHLVRGAGVVGEPGRPGHCCAPACAPMSRRGSTSRAPALPRRCAVQVPSTCLQLDVTRCAGITEWIGRPPSRRRTGCRCRVTALRPHISRWPRPSPTSGTSSSSATTNGSRGCCSTEWSRLLTESARSVPLRATASACALRRLTSPADLRRPRRHRQPHRSRWHRSPPRRVSAGGMSDAFWDRWHPCTGPLRSLPVAWTVAARWVSSLLRRLP